MKLWTDDVRTPDHGHPISSPCEPNGSGELKRDYDPSSDSEPQNKKARVNRLKLVQKDNSWRKLSVPCALAVVQQSMNTVDPMLPSTFSFRSDLTRHKKNKHENLRFKCERCSGRFCSLSNLNRQQQRCKSTNNGYLCLLCQRISPFSPGYRNIARSTSVIEGKKSPAYHADKR